MNQDERLLYSRTSAAKALDLPTQTIDSAIRSGQLEVRRIGRRILIPAESLSKFIAEDRKIPRQDQEHTISV
jgi:excisionase family DNA binding protein